MLKRYWPIALVLVLVVGMCSCGILNLGGTNEDGTPKTATDARLFLRSLGDAALQTWGTQALREHAPAALAAFDVDENGVLTLLEVEAQINLNDPNATTQLLVLAITLYQNRPKQ